MKVHPVELSILWSDFDGPRVWQGWHLEGMDFAVGPAIYDGVQAAKDSIAVVNGWADAWWVQRVSAPDRSPAGQASSRADAILRAKALHRDDVRRRMTRLGRRV